MPNAWLNHVRQFRKNNKNMSYKQLLRHAKNSYGGANNQMNQNQMNQQNQNQSGGANNQMNQNQMNQQNQNQSGGVEPGPPSTPTSGPTAIQNMLRSLSGGSYQGMESRSSLTRSASSVGGRRSRSRKTRRHRR